MTDSGILVPIAGISMSFAGFASLFIALRGKGDEWTPFERLQLNSIVSYAFASLFGSLGVIAMGEPAVRPRWIDAGVPISRGRALP